MNTLTTNTSMDGAGEKGKKKFVREKDVLYKNDRITVWATGNGRVAKGVEKQMHPILAGKLIKKGFYSESRIEPEVAVKEPVAEGYYGDEETGKVKGKGVTKK